MKHFDSGYPIDLLRVDQEKKLAKILAKEAPIDRDATNTVAGAIVQFRVEEEEEERGNPRSLS